MSNNSKLAKLQKLNESQLREDVIIPLLGRLGYKAATLYHGSRERGKDIICFDYDKLMSRTYLGIVAKASDLNGSVSSNTGLREVLFQVEQCFDVPYEDLFGMAKITMDQVWVVTSGKIVSGAADSIYENLHKRNLSKLVRFISGEMLVQLIDENFNTYWDTVTETSEQLREQRDRLKNFCEKLLVTFGGSKVSASEVVNQLVNSSFPPQISISASRKLSRLSPYSVEGDLLPEKYNHNLFSEQCGIIRDVFLEAKQKVYYAMFDVDELMEKYEKVIEVSDPNDFIKGFDSELSDEYPFRDSFCGTGSDATRDIEYLRDGISDIDEFLSKLEKKGLFEYAIAVFDSLDLIEGDITRYIEGIEKNNFELHFTIQGDGSAARLVLEYGALSKNKNYINSKHKKTEIKTRRGKEIKVATTIKNIKEGILASARKYFDELID